MAVQKCRSPSEAQRGFWLTVDEAQLYIPVRTISTHIPTTVNAHLGFCVRSCVLVQVYVDSIKRSQRYNPDPHLPQMATPEDLQSTINSPTLLAFWTILFVCGFFGSWDRMQLKKWPPLFPVYTDLIYFVFLLPSMMCVEEELPCPLSWNIAVGVELCVL